MIAALYDIHGNLPALEAVLEDVGRAEPDAIVVGGDVFPGPLAGEALDRLRAITIPVHFLHGNGERATLDLRNGKPVAVPEAYISAIKWGAERLRPEQETFLTAWPSTVWQLVEGQGVLFCHATPQNDLDIFTRATPEDRLLPVFQRVEADVVVCGHTHMQFDRRVGRLRVVNAGSVGMPFGAPGAYWLLLGKTIELRRTDYDLAAAAERIRGSGYPQAEQFASTNVLNPPSEEQMIDVFERAAIGAATT